MSVRSILAIYDLIAGVCVADAAIVLAALNQEARPLQVSEIIRLVAKESEGQTLLHDQSVRNTLRKLEKLGFLESKTMSWGKKRTKTKYSLMPRGLGTARLLRTFSEETRKLAKTEHG